MEVLLDGIPVKGSPLTPQVSGLPQQANPATAKDKPKSKGSLADQLQSFRWLKENRPAPVPELPPPEVASATAGSSGSSEESAARLAWRAADEWRHLTDAREALERSREQLDEHQAVLMNVGDAVLSEVERLQEWEKRIQGREASFSEVEKKLEGMRADLSRQYLQQQRAMEISSYEVSNDAVVSTLQPLREIDVAKAEGSMAGYPRPRQVSALTVDSDASPVDRGSVSGDRARQSGDERRKEGSAEEELITLQRGIEQKRRQLRVLEEEASNGTRGAGQTAARDLAGEVHPMLEGSALSESAGRSTLSSRLLRSPPPPPAPPPSMPRGQPSSSRTPVEGRPSPQAQAASPTGTSDEIGKAMQQLFSSFASRAAGSVALPRGGRSGRVALGLQDYLRLAHASQLRISQAELEAAFGETLDRFGNRDSGEPALAFELFVELLVLTACRQFPDLEDADATSALFEVHLMPLARRLKQMESRGSNSMQEASSSTYF